MKCPHCGHDASHPFASPRGWSHVLGDGAGCLFTGEAGIVRVIPISLVEAGWSLSDDFPGQDGLLFPEIHEEEGLTYLLWRIRASFLADRASSGPLSPELVWSWFRSVVGALALIHAAGRVHGHIHGHSILVDANNRAFLIGYGILDGTPSSDLTALAEVFTHLVSGFEPYPGLGAFRALLQRMTEGEFSSASEITALGLPFLLREFSDSTESTLTRVTEWYRVHHWWVWGGLAVLSMLVSLVFSHCGSASFEPFRPVPLPELVVESIHLNRRVPVNESPDLSFEFNRLGAGADLYIYIPRDFPLPSKVLKALGLQGFVPSPGAHAYSMTSWRRVRPFTQGGGDVLATAGLLTEVGYDPAHPDVNSALLYMKIPPGHPPKGSVWRSLLASDTMPAALAALVEEGHARVVLLFSSKSDTEGLVEPLSVLLDSLDGVRYSIVRRGTRLYVELWWKRV